MKISLILCTINRVREIENFLFSLSLQTYKNFEVIIVDQNKDDRIKNILNNFSTLDIKYLKSDIGLSKARNIGLKHVSGDIVGFPDDNCIYPNKLLSNIKQFFENEDYDILMGMTIDKYTGNIVAGKNISFSQELKPSFILGSSTTLFIKSNIIISFDERFGLGAVFNAEEENDLVFRLLKEGYKGFYNPNINYVYHPPSDLNYLDLYRAKKRAIGLGAFIAKHLKTKEGKIYFIKYNIIRPLAGSILYLLKLDIIKSKFYFYRFIGIWQGFIQYYKVKK